jgi:hypothetical protein
VRNYFSFALKTENRARRNVLGSGKPLSFPLAQGDVCASTVAGNALIRTSTTEIKHSNRICMDDHLDGKEGG